MYLWNFAKEREFWGFTLQAKVEYKDIQLQTEPVK